MSELKINLDLQVLEKILLDADGNIPLEIKQSIAQTFSNRYLKGLIEKDVKQVLTEQVKNEVMKYVEKENPNSWYSNHTLVKDLRIMINNFAKEAVKEAIIMEVSSKAVEISKQIETILLSQKSEIDKIIDIQVDKKFKAFTKKLIDN